MKFKNKIVLITGASRGIGKEIAMAFAKEGAVVGINYFKSKNDAEILLEEINEFNGKAILLQADVTRSDQVNRMIKTLLKEYSRIDILINNAGITRDNLLFEITEDDWDQVIKTNLKSVFLVTKAAAKIMMLNKYGRIINISSIAAAKGSRGHANYAASKGGINAFTKTAAVELATKGITINAVSPGIIETDMSKNIISVAKDQILKEIPLRKIGQTKDVASLVLFLASEEAGYITGEIINVSGGL